MYTPKPVSPRQNKILLVLNGILIPTTLALGGVSIYYKQWVSLIAMTLVLLSAILNTYNCWKRLKEKS